MHQSIGSYLGFVTHVVSWDDVYVGLDGSGDSIWVCMRTSLLITNTSITLYALILDPQALNLEPVLQPIRRNMSKTVCQRLITPPDCTVPAPHIIRFHTDVGPHFEDCAATQFDKLVI